MKKLGSLVLLISIISLPCLAQLDNPANIGQASRNQAVVKSFEVGDTLYLPGLDTASATYVLYWNNGVVTIDTLPTSGGGGNSPWTTSGSNIYRPSGNVGIGTSTPGSRLQVIGDGNALNITDTSLGYPNGITITDDLLGLSVEAIHLQMDSVHVLLMGSGPFGNQMQLGWGTPGDFSPLMIVEKNNFVLLTSGTNGVEAGFDYNNGGGSDPMISGFKFTHSATPGIDSIDLLRGTGGVQGVNKEALITLNLAGQLSVGRNADNDLDTTSILQVQGDAHFLGNIISDGIPFDSAGLQLNSFYADTSSGEAILKWKYK